jgi:NAD(P)-dependent dehydrogenase (short-subunit alcohol dehydrogenase family)
MPTRPRRPLPSRRIVAAAAGGRRAGAVGPAEVAERLVERAVAAFGRLDALVHQRRHPARQGALEDVRRGLRRGARRAPARHVHLRARGRARMRAQGEAGGRIVVVGSPAGQRGNFGQTNYSAAKAAHRRMVRTWAMECGPRRHHRQRGGPGRSDRDDRDDAGVRAACRGLPSATGRRSRPGCAPVEGFGTPDDAAGLVVYLASAASAAVTGQAIGIGGDKLSLWTHPTEAAAAYRAGGWSADDIALAWRTSVGAAEQTVGIRRRRNPEETA